MIPWLVTGASLLVSLVALIWVRRVSKRLQELSHLYWELRYQHSELQTRLQGTGRATPPAEPAPRPGGTKESFVPLSAVRR